MKKTGKVSSSVFSNTIYPKLGKKLSDVLVGPLAGVDAGVIELDDVSVLTLTTDPLFVMPELGWEKAVWFAIHILASDSATTAIPPRWITLDLNLPLEFSDEDFAEMWEQFHHVCFDLELAIVTGHTGRYENCSFPTIGSGTVLGIGKKERFITPQMAQVGDKVLITKSIALETTAFIGTLCYEKIKSDCGLQTANDAKSLFHSLSVVKDALLASSIGVRENGVTTMHDATERGVQGALVEIAEASNVGMMIQSELLPIHSATQVVCETYLMNPYAASSEGTLLITCHPNKEKRIIEKLVDNGIECTLIGEIVPKEEEVRWSMNNRISPLTLPDEDPYWELLTKLSGDLKKFQTQ